LWRGQCIVGNVRRRRREVEAVGEWRRKLGRRRGAAAAASTAMTLNGVERKRGAVRVKKWTAKRGGAAVIARARQMLTKLAKEVAAAPVQSRTVVGDQRMAAMVGYRWKHGPR
jgi:hypothetical protein